MIIFVLFNWLWPQPLVLLAVVIFDVAIWLRFLWKTTGAGTWEPNIGRWQKILTTVLGPELILYLLIFGRFL